jgi:hypothetical protein
MFHRNISLNGLNSQLHGFFSPDFSQDSAAEPHYAALLRDSMKDPGRMAGIIHQPSFIFSGLCAEIQLESAAGPPAFSPALNFPGRYREAGGFSIVNPSAAAGRSGGFEIGMKQPRAFSRQLSALRKSF